jgi:hypothetical protein
MVLPIINGAKCSSTRRRVNVCGSKFGTDGQQELQQYSSCCHHIAMTRNPEQTLMATLNITYLPASAWDERSAGDGNDQNKEGT